MSGGSNIKTFLVGVETTPGTAVTTDKDVGIVTDIGSGVERTNKKIQGSGSRVIHSNIAQTEQGVINLTNEFQNGRLFEAFFGTPTHADSSSDWSHTFTPSNSPKTMTVLSGDNLSAGDIGKQHTRMLGESFTLRTAINDSLTLQSTLRGDAPTKVTSVAAHVEDALEVMTAKYLDVQINSTSVNIVQSAEFTCTATLDPVFGGGSVDLKGLNSIDLTFTFKATVGIEDATYVDHVINNDVTSIDFNCENGTAFGSGKVGIEIGMDDVTITKGETLTRVGSTTYMDIEAEVGVSSFVTFDDISSSNW